VTPIFCRPLPAREFAEWRMAFRRFDDPTPAPKAFRPLHTEPAQFAEISGQTRQLIELFLSSIR